MPQIQLLVVQPTPFCNIDCRYCYLPDRADKSVVGDATLRNLFTQVFETGWAADGLSVVWHAGEPTVLPADWYRRAFRLIDELRLSGAYPGLADRALKKEAAIAASATPDASAPAGLRGPALRLWYFENRLRRAAPDDVAEYAARIRFADPPALDAAVYREWLYLRQKPQD